MKTILIHFAIKYNGDWDQIYQALERKEKVTIKQLAEVEEMLKNNKWKCTTILDMDYPHGLRDLFKPPFVIWSYGELENLNKNKYVAIHNEFVNEKTNKEVDEFLAKEASLVEKALPTYSKFEQIDPKHQYLYIPNESYEDKLLDFDETKNLLVADFPPTFSPNEYKNKSNQRLQAGLGSELNIISAKPKDKQLLDLMNEFRYCGKKIYLIQKGEKIHLDIAKNYKKFDSERGFGYER